MKKMYVLLTMVGLTLSVSSCKKEELAKPAENKIKILKSMESPKGGEDKPKTTGT